MYFFQREIKSVFPDIPASHKESGILFVPMA